MCLVLLCCYCLVWGRCCILSPIFLLCISYHDDLVFHWGFRPTHSLPVCSSLSMAWVRVGLLCSPPSGQERLALHSSHPSTLVQSQGEELLGGCHSSSLGYYRQPRVMLVGICRGRGLQSNGGRGGDNWSGY